MTRSTTIAFVTAAIALLLPATVTADDILQAPNATFLLESNVLDGNQSNNLGPAAQWVLDNYWEQGDCPKGDSYEYCDILRFGAAVFAGSDCQPGADLVVEPHEDGGAPVEDFITSNDTTHLCGDHKYRPLADALYQLRRDTLDDFDDPDTKTQNAWFDHPHLTLAVVSGLPPENQHDGDEVRQALEAACDVSSGVAGEIPPMMIWTMVARLHDDDAVPFARLLSAAGRTGLCCDTANHGDECDPTNPAHQLDVCAQLGDKSETDLRNALATDRYHCITAEDTWRTGALDFETTGNNLPQITCHLNGLGPGNAQNADVCNEDGRMATDLLGAFACIRQLPRDQVGDPSGLRICDAAGCQSLSREHGDFQFIDDSETLMTLAGEHCDDIASGTAHLEVENCPDRGQPCDTGQPGRCADGVIDCTDDGTAVCEPLRDPMPEICNGLDNSCDGQIDNVDHTVHLLPEHERHLACDGQPMCVCRDGPEHGHSGHDLASFLDAHQYQCLCSSTLEAPDDESGPPPSTHRDSSDTDEPESDHQGCTAAGALVSSTGWILVLLFALLIIRISAAPRTYSSSSSDSSSWSEK